MIKMHKTVYFFAVLLLSCATLGACAEFKSAGKTIGHATKDAATDIGHGTKRVVNEITEE
jgi:predicted small secreted protein